MRLPGSDETHQQVCHCSFHECSLGIDENQKTSDGLLSSEDLKETKVMLVSSIMMDQPQENS